MCEVTMEQVTDAAETLARSMYKTVYVTNLRGGKQGTGAMTWAITLEKDPYNSVQAVQPDGTVLECDVLT